MVVSILTGSDFMKLVLDIAGFKCWRSYKERRISSVSSVGLQPTPSLLRHFGLIFRHRSTDEGGRIESDANPSFLLLALRFLKAYPTETVLSATFQMTEKTVQTHCSA